MVRAESADAQLAQLVGGVASANAGEGLRVVLEREQRDDRQARDGANGLDRDHQLVEVEERLEHEQVGAAPFQDRRLLGEEPGALLDGESSPSGPIEPPMKTLLPVTSRASRARRTPAETICSNSSSR